MADLTKNQRNEIFRALVAGGIDPAECVLSYYNSLGGEVKHSPSGSKISIPASFVSVNLAGGRRDLPVDYKIGSDPGGRSAVRGGFSEFVAQISKWAADVREWMDAPD
jgi:hypothetical protein